jgi:hypothetical protein
MGQRIYSTSFAKHRPHYPHQWRGHTRGRSARSVPGRSIDRAERVSSHGVGGDFPSVPVAAVGAGDGLWASVVVPCITARLRLPAWVRLRPWVGHEPGSRSGKAPTWVGERRGSNKAISQPRTGAKRRYPVIQGLSRVSLTRLRASRRAATLTGGRGRV